MQCTKVTTTSDRLLDPQAAEWANIPGETLKMDATPLANQPSEYIKASRDEKQVGKVRSATVQTAHNDKDIFFRLTWEDAEKNVQISDNNVFPDGCGILIPLSGGDPPIDEMGSKDFPVNAWFWRADFKEPEARNMVAKGLGSTLTSKQSPIKAKGAWNNGQWSVVFTRPLSVPEQKDDAVQLAIGTPVKIGFSIWEGANGERAGVKSFSKEWRELVLEA